VPRTEAVFVMPDLKGPEGNAFVLLGRAKRALREAGQNDEQQNWFYTQATSGDYKNLLETIMEWFIVVAPKTEYVVINDAVELLQSSSEDEEDV
jgi:hypothetical protein